jgi:hypothetical protein
MTSDLTVEFDQEYVACTPSRSIPGEHYIRIRVLHSGLFDDSKVLVATVHRSRDGREFLDRRRQIERRQLHANPNRKTGYRLVQHADGTPAEVTA